MIQRYDMKHINEMQFWFRNVNMQRICGLQKHAMPKMYSCNWVFTKFKDIYTVYTLDSMFFLYQHHGQLILVYVALYYPVKKKR